MGCLFNFPLLLYNRHMPHYHGVCGIILKLRRVMYPIASRACDTNVYSMMHTKCTAWLEVFSRILVTGLKGTRNRFPVYDFIITAPCQG